MSTLVARFVALIFVLLIVTSCTAGTKPEEVNASLVDKSFITGEPCAAPCWYELKVDETTEDDVLEKVRDIQFIDFVSRFDETLIWGNDKTARKIHFDCLYDSQRYAGCISFVTSEGVLKRIQISVLYQLTIKMMVEKLGRPSSYIPFTEPGESIACSMTFFWVDKRIVASNYQKAPCPDKVAKLQSDTPIHTLFYSANDDRYLQMCSGCVEFPGIK